MTFLIPEETKLTVDSRGRVRVSAERRNALLTEIGKSGLTARAFARLMGVHESAFFAWNLHRSKVPAD
jgi:D-arabinose 5-phosphate isomerase GutQ